MHRYLLRRRVPLLFAAAVVPLTFAAAWAEARVRWRCPPRDGTAVAVAARAPTCVVDTSKARFDTPLVRVSRRLAAGRPLKIVALGSSSTGGAGASTPAASYPSRLEVELAPLSPRHKITVLNRGVGGEKPRDMSRGFEPT